MEASDDITCEKTHKVTEPNVDLTIYVFTIFLLRLYQPVMTYKQMVLAVDYEKKNLLLYVFLQKQ